MLTARKLLGILLSVLIVAGSSARAQQLGSDEYYVGDGEGGNLESARAAAMMSLTQQIQVFISTSFEQRITDGSGHADVSAVAHTVAKSTIILSDVGERVKTFDGDRFLVTKFVSRESVAGLFRMRRTKMLELVKGAFQDLAGKSSDPVELGSALKQLYWAYLLASIHPDTVRCTFPRTAPGSESPEETTLGSGIPRLMQSLARKVEIHPLRRFQDGEAQVWQCKATCAGQPIQHLSYEYFDGMGQTIGEVVNGKAKFTLYFPDDTSNSRERELAVGLECRFVDEMDDVLRAAEGLQTGRQLIPLLTVVLRGTEVVARPRAEVVSTGRTGVLSGRDTSVVPPVISELLAVRGDLDKVKSCLRNQKRHYRIEVGKASDFESLEGLYAAIFSHTQLEVVARYNNGRAVNVLTNEPIDLKEQPGLTVTWIDVLERKK
jgi:hypothetical protein